ncbi:hypothetical protein BDY21DRAFT_146643 [Lineolata rhizophorae]|uniref:F-box domain-containing protein n=1 Tax=Lineolata rhizophorae TaxID=578093 RepID=A0A6A6NMW3_9PEZI|nr:hypothetical protein BDY21DRAFT_146643 [Lineolata rhizophorae]
MASRSFSGFRSETEFDLREKDAAAIIWVAAFHCRDFDRAVIWFPPDVHRDVQPSISGSFARPSNAGLGSLDQLSLELLFEVCRQLDLLSLFKFRQVNLYARLVVNSLLEYKKTISYGLNPLCALLRTRLGSGVTLSDFYRVMRTKNCELCGHFGGFVFLPTWTRCCFDCLQQAPETRMETLDSIQKRLRLTPQEVLQIGSFQPLSGFYSMDESWHDPRFKLVSIQRAASVLQREATDEEQRQAQPRNSTFQYMASCALPFFDVGTGMIEHGISCAGCQLAVERIMNREERSRFTIPKYIVDYKGFLEHWEWYTTHKVFSHEGFLEHFKWCKEAQDLYTSSEKGTVEPAERPS